MGEEKKNFTWKEKLAHYKAVAEGTAPVKENSKYSKKEQEAYARGQLAARQEANVITFIKNGPKDEVEDYKRRRKERNEQYKKEHPEKGGKGSASAKSSGKRK